MMIAKKEVVRIVVHITGCWDTEWKSLDDVKRNLAERKVKYVHNEHFGIVHVRNFPLAEVKGWLAGKDVRIEWREIKEK